MAQKGESGKKGFYKLNFLAIKAGISWVEGKQRRRTVGSLGIRYGFCFDCIIRMKKNCGSQVPHLI